MKVYEVVDDLDRIDRIVRYITGKGDTTANEDDTVDLLNNYKSLLMQLDIKR
jgi:hypothetical protein